jgi:nucleotide-binding universal stress UspA family protein
METPTILCTIDFSDSSKHALEWAIQVARKLKAHLSILYTYRLVTSQKEEVLQMKKKLEDDSAKTFLAWEKELLKGRGVLYDFKTEIGFMNDRITEHSKKNAISLLVIGRNGNIKNKESFDELVNHIDIPLVIVP